MGSRNATSGGDRNATSGGRAGLIAVGIIASTHGVRGELKVRSLSGEAGHLLGLREATRRRGDEETPVTFVGVRPQGPGVIVKVPGLETPEKARALIGFEIWVPREMAAPLAGGEYYAADLCGCRLEFNGQEVGRVRSVWEGGPTQLLEVVGRGGKSFLVPFSDHFIGEVDVSGGTILLTEEEVLG